MRAAVLGLLIGLAVLLAGGTALAVSPYPGTLPDFAHPGTVHGSYYGVAAGQQDRPMLVILRAFTDLPLPTGFDETWAQTTFFGAGFPSASNYFSSDSFGDLVFSPASEGCGAANNGVAVVTTDTRANFDAMTEPARNRSSVDAANACVNFAVYDANNDGTISNLELVIMHVTAPNSPTENCGATRGINPGAVDGKNFAGNFGVSMGTTATNLMTHIHEIAHSALNMRDLYGFGVGALDISGPTCGAGNAFFMRTSAWEKLHWGWISPTVVVNDGYYLVNRADAAGQAFILYDYARGANDYFLVENRQVTANTYDASASDSGLVIWRIDDSKYDSSDQTIRPIDIMRPDGTTNGGCDSSGVCYGGSNGDAWDPSDSATPQRTMSRSWRDGANSLVAVRAIGPSGDAIRAYFDVRGPGVLVDPTDAKGLPLQFDVTPEEANPVSFTVMNTGEATDTFAFSVVGLPAGWSSTTTTMSLAAGAGATANVAITVPADAATGVYTVRARGVSTTDGAIVTEVEFRVKVVLHQTGIANTGLTSAPWGEPAGFKAQLSDLTDSSEIVDGASVTFQLFDGVNSQSVTVTSDSSGIATASPALTVPPGNYSLTISMPRLGKHAAASVTVAYTVLKRPTAISYNGDTTAEYSDPATVTATLTDALSGAALGSKNIDFALGTQTASAASDASGVASTVIVVNQPSGAVSVDATFVEDDLYLGSSVSTPFSIEKEDLTFVYTGSTLVSNSVTPTLASQATQEADGFAGDLSLADATFSLAPTLTLLPYEYTTAVDGLGASATAATGLPVDLWTVTIAVPVSNLYWEGASTAAAELVVYDPNGSITGGPQGLDQDGLRTRATMTGRYIKDQPKGHVRFYSVGLEFSGSDYRWIVVVGNQAIVEIDGAIGQTQATLRLRVRDGGEPASGVDTYQGVLRNSGGTQLYDSGQVIVDRGNLQVKLK